MHAFLGSCEVPSNQRNQNPSVHQSKMCISRCVCSGLVELKEEHGDVEKIMTSVNSERKSSTRPMWWLAKSVLASQILTTSRRRLAVLAALLILQSMSQVILQQYEEFLRNHVVVFFFMGMVVGAGGNASNQAAVSVISAMLAPRTGISEGHSSVEGVGETEQRRLLLEKEGRALSLAAPTAPSAMPGRSVCIRLWRLVQRCHWGYLNRGGSKRIHRSRAVSVAAVPRYELVVAFFCGLILMIIGALRVSFFIWFDNGSEYERGDKATETVPFLSFPEQSKNVALVMGLSLSIFLVVFASVMIGATLPYVLDFVGFSTEHAAPIVQVLMDLLGTWLCCAVCHVFLFSQEGIKKTNAKE